MSSQAIYEAFVSIVPEAKNLRKQLAKEFDAAGPEAGRHAGRGIHSGILGSIGKLAAPLAAAFAGLGIGKIIKDSIGNASDLAEAGTAITAVFGSADATIQKFAKGSAQSLGQSTNQTLDAARVFGVFGKAAGLSGEDLAGFSTDFITLAGDLASFNNTTPEAAIEALGAGLRGESEPLRQYGVLLDDATLKARATEMGIYSGTGALTAQQKVLASQAEIMAQTGLQQGDFAKTSGGLANQQRILSAGLENLSTTFGAIFLPAATGVVGYLNTSVVPAFQDLVGVFTGETITGPLAGVAQNLRDFYSGFTGGADAVDSSQSKFSEWGAVASEVFSKISEVAGKVFDTLGPVLAELGPKFLDLLVAISPVGGAFDLLAPVLPAIAAALSDVISTLSTSIGEALPHVFATLAELMPSLVAGFLDLLPAISDLIVSVLPVLADLLVQLLPPLVELVTNCLPPVIDLIVWLADVLENCAPAISFIGGAIGGLIGWLGTPTQKAFGDFADLLSGFGPVGEFFAGIIGGLGDLLKDGLIGALDIVIGGIGDFISNTFGMFVDFWSNTAGMFADFFSNTVGMIGDFIGNSIGMFAEFPAKIGEFFAGVGQWLLDAGMNLLSGLATGIAAGFIAVVYFFTGLPAAIGAFLMGATLWLGTTGMDILTGLLNGIVDGWNAVAAWIANLPAMILGFLTSAATWLVTTGSDILAGLGAGIATGWTAAVTFFTELPGKIGAFLAGAGAWLVQSGSDLINGLLNGVKNMWNGFMGFLGSIPGSVAGFFSGIGSWLFDAGKDLINGLLDGVKSLAGTIGKFFLGLLPDWIVGPFKAAMGINSPSTVFAGYGENTVEGYLIGVARTKGKIDSAMKSLVSVPSIAGARIDASVFGSAARAEPVARSGGGNVYIDKIVAPDQDPRVSGRIMGREFARYGIGG